jgi:hypothetical protein
MASFGSRKGASDGGSVILMVLTFLTVAGFLYWLRGEAADTQVAVVEAGPSDAGLLDSAPIVDAPVFGSDPLAHTEGVIRINNLAVQSAVGGEAFFVEMPNHSGPYLVKMGARVIADSVSVPSGSTVSVVGRVYAMSDSVADDWVASGAITEDDKILATFAQSYMEIVDIIVMAGGGDTDGGDGGGDN